MSAFVKVDRYFRLGLDCPAEAKVQPESTFFRAI